MTLRSNHNRKFMPVLQRGAAAVEFALIAMLMITLLLGLLVFWRYFQAHQSLTRAAGDGARAAHSVIALGFNPCDPTQGIKNKELIENRIKQTITSSLKQSSMPGDVDTQLAISSLQWGSCPSDGNSSISFTISYALEDLLGGTFWGFNEPHQLRETSSLHFASML